jgi:hypothetical protein
MSNSILGQSFSTGASHYEPVTDPNPLNVVFLPVMTDGTRKYIAAATDYTGQIENMSEYSEESILVEDSNEETKNKVSMFDIGKNPVASFYIGSITAVGLYVLFCLLRKTK